MEPTFRASMNWLHTWAGVVLGGLLFAIFWMGTLSVFDREIDLWMMPVTRIAPPATFSFEALRPSLEQATAAKAPQWTAILPTERQPVARVTWRDASGMVTQYVDVARGIVLADPGTWAGTRFLYPFHYMLHVRFADLGIWLVGLASMAMLALCVSGVIVHRRIFADFFTFRVTRRPRRTILDLHTATGVLGSPFHVVITVSGLIIFYSIYFPGAWHATFSSRSAFLDEVFDNYARPSLGRPAPVASLDAMAMQASSLWGGAAPRSFSVRWPDDAGAYVRVERPFDDRIARGSESAYLDGATGEMLAHRVELRPVKAAQRVIMGLHLVHFRHWTLRWLYFGLGLVGCALIATGYLFWLETRRREHERLGMSGVRVVEGLTIGSVSGIVVATLAFFVVNRVLPLDASFAGHDRAALEIWTFYLTWLAAFAHAWACPRHAWAEQCIAIAIIAVAAVVLNWLTTGDHFVRTLTHPHLHAVAGMDFLLLAAATVASYAAIRIRRPA